MGSFSNAFSVAFDVYIPGPGPTYSYVGAGGIFLAGSTYSFYPDDVLLLLSGGVGNSNSSNSIGGPASYSQCPEYLFNNIPITDLRNGITDYRCVYLYNANPVYSLAGLQIFVQNKPYGGCNVQVGVATNSEVQNVMVNGNPSGGSFTLSYTNNTNTTDFVVNYNSNPAIWASNFQSAIRAVPGLEDTTIGHGAGTNVVVFTVNFQGQQANKFQNILELSLNNLIGITEILISKIIDGSPINSIASYLTSDSNSPPNVTFQGAYTASLPIGEIQPGDLVPIWIQRNLPPNSPSFQDDGFLFAIVGDPTD